MLGSAHLRWKGIRIDITFITLAFILRDIRVQVLTAVVRSSFANEVAFRRLLSEAIYELAIEDSRVLLK